MWLRLGTWWSQSVIFSVLFYKEHDTNLLMLTLIYGIRSIILTINISFILLVFYSQFIKSYQPFDTWALNVCLDLFWPGKTAPSPSPLAGTTLPEGCTKMRWSTYSRHPNNPRMGCQTHFSSRAMCYKPAFTELLFINNKCFITDHSGCIKAQNF